MSDSAFFSKKRIYLCWGLIFISHISMAQTKLSIIYHDDTEQTYSVSEDGKVYFQDSNLIIEDETILVNAEISSIRKIIFPENETANIINTDQESDLFIYPNPAKDFIFIANSQEERIIVKIYSVNGQLMLSGEFDSGSQINVGNLKKGLYLIKVNEKTLKFSKL